ncbi:helix-turn-helix domain-containing protein [Streptomyces umbrinus]|uniref:helix-turn-helix domain-containing protein n=1 Tax=Streptomyces umbrinus TaxID=67370 RepID=UPI003C2F2624
MQIRRLREGRGYSLEELAERSGLSFRGLIYIEHGQRSPSVLTLLDIAAGLDVEPGELVNHITREESGKAGPQLSGAPTKRSWFSRGRGEPAGLIVAMLSEVPRRRCARACRGAQTVRRHKACTWEASCCHGHARREGPSPCRPCRNDDLALLLELTI